MVNNISRMPRPEITWYRDGAKVASQWKAESSADIIKGLKILVDHALENVAKVGSYRPTTWEETEKYIKESRANGTFSPQDRMVYIMNLKTVGPETEKVHVIMFEEKLIIPLPSGSAIVTPAVDMPPHVFRHEYERPESSYSPIMGVTDAPDGTYALAAMCYWARD